MPLVQRISFVLSLGLVLVVLAGVGARRLYRICHAFPVYLAAVWVGDALMFLWPARFYVWTFWLAKETVYVVLKLAIAAEIVALAYATFPAAAAAVRRLALLVLGCVLLLSTVQMPYGSSLPTVATELLSRLAQGTALVFCATWGLVHWYHLPLHRVHRAILRGFVSYMAVFAAGAALISLGWAPREQVNIVDGAAYALLLGYWSWEAWRAPAPEHPFLRQLQPWRVRV